MIQGLIDRVGQTRLPEKDTDAEHLLQTTLGQNPDALYILSQTVLVQKYALEQAQKQLADLKSQLDQSRQQPPPAPEHHTSFLGSLLGRNDPPPRLLQTPSTLPFPTTPPSPAPTRLATNLVTPPAPTRLPVWLPIRFRVRRLSPRSSSDRLRRRRRRPRL